MFEQLCKQHFPMILFRQPIFTSKTYNHAVTYNHASADGNLQKTLVKLQKKVNQLNQIGNAEQEEKERETLQLENKKEREIILAEKEKDLKLSLQLEKMKLAYEERIKLEKLNIEKIRIKSEMQQKTIDIVKDVGLKKLG